LFIPFHLRGEKEKSQQPASAPIQGIDRVHDQAGLRRARDFLGLQADKGGMSHQDEDQIGILQGFFQRWHCIHALNLCLRLEGLKGFHLCSLCLQPMDDLDGRAFP
jgi:hypothetical protein